MKGPNTLIQAEDNWQTDMGAAFVGERAVLRGKDIFKELNTLSWFKYLMFGINGKIYSNNEIELIEKLWTCTVSYPDPRIWNNRISALSGTARATAQLSISAAIATTEATIYGNQIIKSSINLIHRAKKIKDNKQSLEKFVINELKNKRAIAGYGRPIISTDERIEPIILEAKKLNLADGPHLKIAFDIEKILQAKRYRIKMNISALNAAIMADLGFNEKDYYYASILSFSAGMIPAYIDTADNHKEGTFFPLACKRLNYKGKNIRHW